MPGSAGMWKAGVSAGVSVVLSKRGSGPWDPTPWEAADAEFSSSYGGRWMGLSTDRGTCFLVEGEDQRPGTTPHPASVRSPPVAPL